MVAQSVCIAIECLKGEKIKINNHFIPNVTRVWTIGSALLTCQRHLSKPPFKLFGTFDIFLKHLEWIFSFTLKSIYVDPSLKATASRVAEDSKNTI